MFHVDGLVRLYFENLLELGGQHYTCLKVKLMEIKPKILMEFNVLKLCHVTSYLVLNIASVGALLLLWTEAL